jgi:integrase
LRALRWRNIDFATATIHVRAGYTDTDGEGVPKSRRVRVVPLIDQAAAALDQLSRRKHFTDPDELVFCNELGGVLSGLLLYRRYIAAAQAAGLWRLVNGERRVLRFHEYADVVVMPMSMRRGCSERFSGSWCRYNQGAWRNARSVSGGW